MIVSIKNESSVHRIAAGCSGARHLVFIRSGRDTRLVQALAESTRDFDLVLSLYQPASAQDVLIAAGVAIYAGGLSKFHAAKLIEQEYKALSGYDFVLFLDGDLEIDIESIRRLFCLAEHGQLDLCQASLTADSASNWSFFLHHDPRARRPRRSNYIEVMGPCFSKHALTLCIPTFDRSISTWGLDLLWPALLGFRNIAIVDAVQMRHIGLPDEENGPFYRYLKSIGIDHQNEAAQLDAECPWGYYPGLHGRLMGWRAPYLRRKFRRTIEKLVRKIRWRQTTPR